MPDTNMNPKLIANMFALGCTHEQVANAVGVTIDRVAQIAEHPNLLKLVAERREALAEQQVRMAENEAKLRDRMLAQMLQQVEFADMTELTNLYKATQGGSVAGAHGKGQNQATVNLTFNLSNGLDPTRLIKPTVHIDRDNQVSSIEQQTLAPLASDALEEQIYAQLDLENE